MDLIPTNADWQRLISENPLAAEQIKRIILERLLAEKEAALAELQESDEAAD